MKKKKQSTISHAYTWVYYNEGKITPIEDKWMMGAFQSKQKAITALKQLPADEFDWAAFTLIELTFIS